MRSYTDQNSENKFIPNIQRVFTRNNTINLSVDVELDVLHSGNVHIIHDSFRHGEKWYEFRSKVQQPMLQPRTAKFYIGAIEDTATSFVNRWVVPVRFVSSDRLIHVQIMEMEFMVSLIIQDQKNQE